MKHCRFTMFPPRPYKTMEYFRYRCSINNRSYFYSKNFFRIIKILTYSIPKRFRYDPIFTRSIYRRNTEKASKTTDILLSMFFYLLYYVYYSLTGTTSTGNSAVTKISNIISEKSNIKIAKSH